MIEETIFSLDYNIDNHYHQNGYAENDTSAFSSDNSLIPTATVMVSIEPHFSAVGMADFKPQEQQSRQYPPHAL